jgi:CDP-diacylglycerol---serine O-phosphatidyltransferase
MAIEFSRPFDRLRFVVVTSFTGLNLIVGIVALLLAFAGAEEFAAYSLLLCVLLDGCDGTLARRWHVTSPFGAQLDSLSDMTSFMIAGAGLIYVWLSDTWPVWIGSSVCVLYALCGAIRLARFNASPSNPRYFQGVPTTFAATALALNFLVNTQLHLHPLVALLGCVLVSLLMISDFPYPKMAVLLSLPRFWWLLVPPFAWLQLSWTVYILTVGYLLVGPVLWFRWRYDE